MDIYSYIYIYTYTSYVYIWIRYIMCIHVKLLLVLSPKECVRFLNWGRFVSVRFRAWNSVPRLWHVIRMMEWRNMDEHVWTCHDGLVDGFEHDFYFSIYWEFHNPNWLSYFSEGLKPATSGIWVGMDENGSWWVLWSTNISPGPRPEVCYHRKDSMARQDERTPKSCRKSP